MTQSPVLAMALQGIDAITMCRKMMGATFGNDAEPGTIRGDFGLSQQYNLVHASDGPETASREIELFFKAEEIVSYERSLDCWIMGND